AVVREASKRAIHIRQHDVQLLGGIALADGRVAEMRTGEGKTFVAPLTAYLSIVAGQPVHIHTVNDYLAIRDSAQLKPLYDLLGLSVGFINHRWTADQRRANYGADVTYVTNHEAGHDYLRDNMATTQKERVLVHGLPFAIVDEADSI